MALEFKNVDIIFNQGIDTNGDPKLTTKLHILENGSFQKVGSISKTYGYDTVSGTLYSGAEYTEAFHPTKLGNFNSQLLAYDELNSFKYSSRYQQWEEEKLMPSVTVDSFPVHAGIVLSGNVDMVVSNDKDIALVAWENPDNNTELNYSLIELQNFTSIRRGVITGTSGIKYPRTINLTDSDKFAITYFNPNSIVYLAMDYDGEITSSSVITNDVNTSGIFDSSYFDSHVWLGVGRSSASGMGVFKITDSGTVAISGALADISPNSLPSSAKLAGISISDSNYSDQLLLAYSFEYTPAIPDESGWTHSIYLTKASLAATDDFGHAYGTINLTTCKAPVQTESSDVFLFGEWDAFQPYNHSINFLRVASGNGWSSSHDGDSLSLGIVSKPFFVSYADKKTGDYSVYVLTAHESNLQSSYFLHAATVPSGVGEAQRLDLVGKIEMGNAAGLKRQFLSTVSSFNEDIRGKKAAYFIGRKKTELRLDDGKFYAFPSMHIYRLTFNDELHSYRQQKLGSNLHVTGGMLWSYDGESFDEHGFSIYPENLSVTNSGGGVLPSGATYYYSAVYEYKDAQGNLHRSAPASPLRLQTTSSGRQAYITVPTYRLGERDINIGLYRTENNGTVFYRLGNINTPLKNDKSVNSLVFNDNTSDATLIGNELLYTTGGILENISPPSVRLIATFKNRVFLVCGNTIWYSKPVYTASEPVEFTDLFTFEVNSEGGDVTAIHPLDDKLVIFKRDRIFYIYGEGPDAAGGTAVFSQPEEITSDVGSNDPRTIVQIPGQLLFRSDKGFYSLASNLQVSYIGADVANYSDPVSFPIVSSTVLNDESEVRFAGTSLTLVYNYLYGQWSVLTESVKDSVLIGEQYYILEDTGPAEEIKMLNVDKCSSDPMAIATGWINLAGIQGYQRVRVLHILGEYRGTSKLRVKVAYDYNNTWAEERLIDPEEASIPIALRDDSYRTTPQGGNALMFRYKLPKQKCASIRFMICDEDTNSEHDYKSFDITALTLEVGIFPKGGNRTRIAASK